MARGLGAILTAPFNMLNSALQRSTRRVAVRAQGPNKSPGVPRLPQRPRQPPEPMYYPPPQVENAVSHDAFHSALEASRPECLRGLAQLSVVCAGLLERRHNSTSGDRLSDLFVDFDADNDNVLTARELSDALSTLGVPLTPEKVVELLSAFEGKADVDILLKSDWAEFVQCLATSDLRRKVRRA